MNQTGSPCAEKAGKVGRENEGIYIEAAKRASASDKDCFQEGSRWAFGGLDFQSQEACHEAQESEKRLKSALRYRVVISSIQYG